MDRSPRPPQAPATGPATPSGYLLAAITMIVIAPPALAGWLAGAAVLRSGRVPRWMLAAAAIVTGGLAALAIGPAVAAGGLVAAVAALGGVLPATLTAGALLEALSGLLVRGVGVAAVTVPAGVAIAAIPARGVAEIRPEWTEQERRRAAKADTRNHRRADRLASQPEQAPDDALGSWIRGDLEPRWRAGRYLILPADVAGLPRLVVGASGSGKSILLVREIYIAGRASRRVVLIDCKGDATMREAAIAAYLRARPDARVLCWPAEPLAGWRGDGSDQLGRLLQVWNFPGVSQWYGEVAATVLRLSLCVPGQPPVTSSGELMARLAGGHLQRLWDADPDIAALLRGIADDIPGVQLRVLNLLASLSGSLDGRRSWDDADLIVCSVPVMANPKDADAAVRVLLGDLAHHIAVRKPFGEAETVVVDELSAIIGGRQAALHVAERGRSAGTASILTVQSQAGLGEPHEAERLIGTSAAVTLLRSPNSEELAKLAGTLLEPEATWQIEGGKLTGRGNAALRARHRLDLNAIRALRPGQAAVIAEGRAALIKVIREQPGAAELTDARGRALPPTPTPPLPERPGLPQLTEREP